MAKVHLTIIEKRVEKLLETVGKTCFIKYYDEFKKSTSVAGGFIKEPYTEQARRTRTFHARTIFKNNLQKIALKLISNSKHISQELRDKAIFALQRETAEAAEE